MIEERIIDGVDVTGCKDYREVEYKEMPVCMNYYNNLPKPPKETEWQYCAGNKYCYYKQLKRLQAENERLNSACLQLQSSELKQHLEKVNCERENYKIHKENEELRKEIKENLHYLACMTEQRNKLKLALEEIKEVLKFYADSWVDKEVYPNLHYDNTKAKEGLSKINEVLK